MNKAKKTTDRDIPPTFEEKMDFMEKRVEHLLETRFVLTRRELEYLIGETGPGHSKADPMMMKIRFGERNLFVRSLIINFPEAATLSELKSAAEERVAASIHSDRSYGGIINDLKRVLKDVKTIDTRPLVLDATFRDMPVTIWVGNGQTVIPDASILLFLKKTTKRGRLPVIVARKICGALFPFFKWLPAIGISTYTTYVSAQTIEAVEKISEQAKAEINKPWLEMQDKFKIKYCEPLADVCGQNGPSVLLAPVLSKVYSEYQQKVGSNNGAIRGTFQQTVRQMPAGKARAALAKWAKERKL